MTLVQCDSEALSQIIPHFLHKLKRVLMKFSDSKRCRTSMKFPLRSYFSAVSLDFHILESVPLA